MISPPFSVLLLDSPTVFHHSLDAFFYIETFLYFVFAHVFVLQPGLLRPDLVHVRLYCIVLYYYVCVPRSVTLGWHG